MALFVITTVIFAEMGQELSIKARLAIAASSVIGTHQTIIMLIFDINC